MKAKQPFFALTLSIFELSVYACTTVSEVQPESMPGVTLEGTAWTLEASIEGQTGSSLIGSTEITLKFETDYVRGSAGCNDYGGAYTLERGALSIPQVDITGQLCLEPAGTMAQETRYLEILQGATIFIWDTDLLTLMTLDGVGLRFVSGLLFGLVHFSQGLGMLPRFFTGWLWGSVRCATGMIILLIPLHFIYNSVWLLFQGDWDNPTIIANLLPPQVEILVAILIVANPKATWLPGMMFSKPND